MIAGNTTIQPTRTTRTARLTRGTLVRQVSYTWDIGSRLVSAPDRTVRSRGVSTFWIDSPVSLNRAHPPFRVLLHAMYDVSGNRTQRGAVINGTGHLVNDYQYDLLNGMLRVDQHGLPGGHAVAEKRVDSSYNALGQFVQIVRYSAVAGTPSDEEGTSTITYDGAHRLIELSHTRGVQPVVAPYSWTYDTLDRIIQTVHGNGTSSFSYDATDQLVGADRSSVFS